MKPLLRPCVLAAAAALAVTGGPAAGEDRGWRARPDEVPLRYTIVTQLVETGLDDGYRIVGEETAVWKNTSHEPVRVLYLHTYANAFRNTRSTFLREAAKDELKLPDDMKYGDMPLPRISVHGDELAPKWVAPDDGNADDRTVVRVELPQAVEPGDSIPIKIDFRLDLPRVFRRMGGHHGFVMAAQWYPKLGMYVGRDSPMRDVHEGWFCHQYHANGEFAADYADYDVTLRYPAEFKVGATGVPVGADVTDEKTGVTTRRYRAESVVDFAWAAGKRFVELEYDVVPVAADRMDDAVSAEWRRVKALLDVRSEDMTLPPVKLVLLLQPEHVDQAQRHVEAARVALGLFGTWMGPYPYPRLTIVDPPWDSRGAGGMEYPTLVTAGTSDDSPLDSQNPEGVIVHEIGHQWLMNLIANNEAEEAWLDEGINTYVTAQALDMAYGVPRQYTDVLGFHFPFVPFYEFPGVSSGWPEYVGLPGWARPADIDAFRLWRDLPPLSWVGAERYGKDPMLPYRRGYLRRAGWDEMVKAGWRYADRASYGANAYARPALFLSSLRRSLADALPREEADRRFLRALREYAREQRFRHPTTEDFLRKFRELAADPASAAEQLVRTAATLDYAVESLRSGDDPELVGLDDKGDVVKKAEKENGAKGAPGKARRTIVRVRRRGEAFAPVWLEVTREGGGTERAVRWEIADQAKERWHDFVLEGSVVAARLDPDGVWLQDSDLSNGMRTAASNARPAVKWSVRFVGWLENALAGYGRFF